jgi:hypothetical protein
MSGAITGTAVAYDPLFGSVGCIFFKMKQVSSSPSPTVVDAVIQVQGSMDGVDWVTLFTTNATTLGKPLGVAADVGTVMGGYRTQAQIVQGMPWMRVVTANGITNGSSVRLSVIMQNG